MADLPEEGVEQLDDGGGGVGQQLQAVPQAQVVRGARLPGGGGGGVGGEGAGGAGGKRREGRRGRKEETVAYLMAGKKAVSTNS